MSYYFEVTLWSLVIKHLTSAEKQALRLTCSLLKRAVDTIVTRLSIPYTSSICLLPTLSVFTCCAEVWLNDRPDRVPKIVRGRCNSQGVTLKVIISSLHWWLDYRLSGWWRDNMQRGSKLILAVDLGDLKCSVAYIDNVLHCPLSAHLNILVGWREASAPSCKTNWCLCNYRAGLLMQPAPDLHNTCGNNGWVLQYSQNAMRNSERSSLQGEEGYITVTCPDIFTLGFPQATRDSFVNLLHSPTVPSFDEVQSSAVAFNQALTISVDAYSLHRRRVTLSSQSRDQL